MSGKICLSVCKKQTKKQKNDCIINSAAKHYTHFRLRISRRCVFQTPFFVGGCLILTESIYGCFGLFFSTRTRIFYFTLTFYNLHACLNKAGMRNRKCVCIEKKMNTSMWSTRLWRFSSLFTFFMLLSGLHPVFTCLRNELWVISLGKVCRDACLRKWP